MFIDVTELGLVAVSGAQSAEFLQGQVSCDVTQVTADQSRLGVLCNPKGRVLAAFRLFYVHPNYYLLLPQAMVPLVIKDLKKYAIFYKIQLSSTQAFSHKIGLSGEHLANTLKKYDFTNSMQDNEAYHNSADVLLNIPGAQPRAILLSEEPRVSAGNIQPFTYWQQLDIESGLASIYPSARELFTPHQLYYHQRQGISFTKGCYTGQDVIARMQYLSQLKNKLYHVVIEQAELPEAGQVILDASDSKQGTLIMATTTEKDSHRYQGLASLHHTAVEKALYLHKESPPLSIVKAV